LPSGLFTAMRAISRLTGDRSRSIASAHLVTVEDFQASGVIKTAAYKYAFRQYGPSQRLNPPGCLSHRRQYGVLSQYSVQSSNAQMCTG
jgi:hypothetical protein